MSLIIHILCKSKEQLSPAEVVDLFNETRLLPALRVEPELASCENDFPESGLRLTYSSRKRPIVVYRSNKKETKDYVKEALADLKSQRAILSKKILKHLDDSIQLIDIEFDPKINELTWTAIEEVDGYIAFKYKGIVYVPDEGFYDDKRQVEAHSFIGFGQE